MHTCFFFMLGINKVLKQQKSCLTKQTAYITFIIQLFYRLPRELTIYSGTSGIFLL